MRRCRGITMQEPPNPYQQYPQFKQPDYVQPQTYAHQPYDAPTSPNVPVPPPPPPIQGMKAPRSKTSKWIIGCGIVIGILIIGGICSAISSIGKSGTTTPTPTATTGIVNQVIPT